MLIYKVIERKYTGLLKKEEKWESIVTKVYVDISIELKESVTILFYFIF